MGIGRFDRRLFVRLVLLLKVHAFREFEEHLAVGDEHRGLFRLRVVEGVAESEGILHQEQACGLHARKFVDQRLEFSQRGAIHKFGIFDECNQIHERDEGSPIGDCGIKNLVGDVADEFRDDAFLHLREL